MIMPANYAFVSSTAQTSGSSTLLARAVTIRASLVLITIQREPGRASVSVTRGLNLGVYKRAKVSWAFGPVWMACGLSEFPVELFELSCFDGHWR